MAAICLMPEAVQRFRTGLKNGSIDPAKLSQMTSEERNKFFEDYVGENSAKDVNSLFESKLLLKNQKQGMITWAKNVAGISEPARKDLVAKISRMDKILNPENKEQFLRDLASTKLGVDVTQAEAKTIADLSKKVEAGRIAMENGGDRLAYGRARVALSNYVNELKVDAQKLTKADFKSAPISSTGRVAASIPGNAKAINASMDNSAIFRQGWKTLWAHPGIWSKNAKQSFVNLVKQFGGKEVMDEVNAEIVSRPTYDQMVKAKLAVGNLEEAFPTTLPEKIPVFGRAYKASEAAYTAFVQKTRADVFDKYLDIAQKSGVDITNETELKSIGKLVNSLTGRASLGNAEPVGNLVNNVFFSPRFLTSNINTLTHALGRDTGELMTGAGGKLTPFARKQAAKNLMKAITGTAAIITIANAVRPGSVELDPRSSDFGKIKVGHTRFDVTGGHGSIMTLAARLASMSSKSTTTGQVTPLNSGKFGAKTGLDVFNDFVSNKLSPAAGLIRNMWKGETPNGDTPTVGTELKALATPIGIQNYQQSSKDPEGANILLSTIADGLGISSSTYGGQRGNKSTWEKSDSKELKQFKQKVGEKKFVEASKTYDNRVTEWLDKAKQNKEYTRLPAEEQKTVVEKKKDKIRADIFKKSNFKYKKTKSSENQYKSLLR